MSFLRVLFSGFGGWQAYAIGAALVFAAGASAGGYAVHKLQQASQAHALKTQIKTQAATHRHELIILAAKHAADLTTTRDRVTVKEVIKYVPTAAVCDVSDDERRLLDHARTGLPEPTAGTDTASARPASTAPLPRRVEVQAHIDCGLKYRTLKTQHQALTAWICQVSTCKN